MSAAPPPTGPPTNPVRGAHARGRNHDAAPRSPWLVGVAGYLLMLGIGSMYGLSALQVELPSLLGLPAVYAVVPFGAASAGLAIGSGIGARVLARLGPRLTGAAGAATWGASMCGAGAFLTGANLVGASILLGLGGIGVGVAYLSIVSSIGPSFPAQPLIGSAIGPLGFASGTAVFALVGVTTIAGSDLATAAGAVRWTGVAVIVLAALAALLPGPRLPAFHSAPGRASAAIRTPLRALLFVNAFPGMLIFAVAADLLTGASPADSAPADVLLAAVTVTLFLGGLLAPCLRTRLGVRGTFVTLLLLRAALLLVVPLTSPPWADIVLVCLVLFGHGAGFSLLPTLMKSADVPGAFAANYGSVLIWWGIAGVCAAVTAAVSLAVTGTYTLALLSASGLCVIGTVWLLVAPARTLTDPAT